MAAALFRFIGGAARDMTVANVFGSFVLLIFMVLCGFILDRGTPSPFFITKKEENNLAIFLYAVLFIIAVFFKKGGCLFIFDFAEKVKKWWIWGYWISPMMYAQNALSVNEMLGHSWDKILNSSMSNETLGVQSLKSRGIFPEAKWYWIGLAALIGFVMLFNCLFTLALAYLKREFL
jgi:hypothetical protein